MFYSSCWTFLNRLMTREWERLWGEKGRDLSLSLFLPLSHLLTKNKLLTNGRSTTHHLIKIRRPRSKLTNNKKSNKTKRTPFHRSFDWYQANLTTKSKWRWKFTNWTTKVFGRSAVALRAFTAGHTSHPTYPDHPSFTHTFNRITLQACSKREV